MGWTSASSLARQSPPPGSVALRRGVDQKEVTVMGQTLRAAQKDELGPAAGKISKWVDHVLGQNYHKYSPSETWSPALNVYEDSSRYVVVVDLAGMRSDGIDIQVDKGVMTISGRRPAPVLPDIGEHMRMHIMEIDNGPFSRTLKLPPTVDAEAIEASYRSGLLWIRIPKRT